MLIKNCINYNYFNNYQYINSLINYDFLIYKECVNKTNKIACGRKKSKIKKTNKPKQIHRKRYILDECSCNVVTKHLNYNNNKEVLILIGIASGPEYFAERYVYRRVYKKYRYLRVVFFMGMAMNHSLNMMIMKENNIFNDMVVFSFISSYYNLTSQLICEFTWVKTYCRNYRWYIHHTSDTYLNIEYVYLFLLKFTKRRCIMGYIIKNNSVQMKSDIFYIPKNIITINIYPNYPTGSGYIIHRTALYEISSIIKGVKPKVWIDDAFLGIVLSRTNISLIDLGILFKMDINFLYSRLYKYMFVHGLSASEIFFLFKSN